MTLIKPSCDRKHDHKGLQILALLALRKVPVLCFVALRQHPLIIQKDNTILSRTNRFVTSFGSYTYGRQIFPSLCLVVVHTLRFYQQRKADLKNHGPDILQSVLGVFATQVSHTGIGFCQFCCDVLTIKVRLN